MAAAAITAIANAVSSTDRVIAAATGAATAKRLPPKPAKKERLAAPFFVAAAAAILTVLKPIHPTISCKSFQMRLHSAAITSRSAFRRHNLNNRRIVPASVRALDSEVRAALERAGRHFLGGLP
jgi:hypothetical protein